MKGRKEGVRNCERRPPKNGTAVTQRKKPTATRGKSKHKEGRKRCRWLWLANQGQGSSSAKNPKTKKKGGQWKRGRIHTLQGKAARCKKTLIGGFCTLAAEETWGEGKRRARCHPKNRRAEKNERKNTPPPRFGDSRKKASGRTKK